MSETSASEAARKVRLMGFDVDGVLTDGTLWFGPDGDTMKGFNTLDGHGLKMLAGAGVELVIISGRSSAAVRHRAANLGIDTALLGVENKREAMRELAAERGLAMEQCGYMGDDIVDLPVLRACGFSAAPANAHFFVRQHVAWVAEADGGRGAVREACEFLLDARGALDALLQDCLR
ncbi:KdsC family phosphatase [Methyloversatilis sp.]|uniref:KdsC family phosphatase n=1 Tax=Methyloversatilis sp. TaxID=2569862 RepID=UPI0035B25D93